MTFERLYAMLSLLLVILGITLLLYVVFIAYNEYTHVEISSDVNLMNMTTVQLIRAIVLVLVPLLPKVIWVAVIFCVAIALISYGIRLSRRL